MSFLRYNENMKYLDVILLLVKMGFGGAARKEFQKASVWEKFKCSGKIYWGEGK